MAYDLLAYLSFEKYQRVLVRMFPGSSNIDLRNRKEEIVWSAVTSEKSEDTITSEVENTTWADVGSEIRRHTSSGGYTMFRGAIDSASDERYGWLTVTYTTDQSVPMGTALTTLQRSFSDALAILRDDLALQTECNQLAVELTERYEELNLVYSTDDQVSYFEEGQQALVRLVHNCADYLDVGMSVLICRERGLELFEINRNQAPDDPADIASLLGASIYDHIEAQLAPIVFNELDSKERERLFSGRQENLIAQPIIDDHGTAIGLLAVVARKTQHTFSNGDRNLLEVMAKKASRIIHTHHDSLTGLMNRSGFESALISALAESRAKGHEHCILHIDIDQLHVVNDLMGHQEGDSLIRRVARVLRQCLRDSDSLARLGGDEFGALLMRCSINDATNISEKISKAVNSLEVISANRQLDVSVSIGVVPMQEDADGIVGLLASAEIACTSAKEQGRNCVQVFEEDNTTLVLRSEEVGWIGRIQEALRNDEFVLYSQPVVPLGNDGRATHYEVLVRMIDGDGQVVSPAAFLPAAERYQLMPMIDRWVIRTAFRKISAALSAMSAPLPTFCINLSGQSFTNNGFLGFVQDAFRQSGMPAERICFEVTETAAISNIDDAASFMNELRSIGCRFSLDDFGAGLSSFGYLKVLPVNYLKIDGSFVREITSDAISRSMVEAINGVGKTMGLSVIAEYVGDEETAELLRIIGIDYGQGFGLGKPAPLERTIERLTEDLQSASA